MDDYTSKLLIAPEHNDVGSESNLERLEGRGLSGARMSYSNKSSNTESVESTNDHALDQSSSTSNTTTSSNDTADIITKTTNTTVNPTTIATTTAVGGVVVASVVIFTSILGNQFKLVDNSLTLSTYRNLEENTISLDYSFDLQYDKSGLVYVKLLSAGHSLTSEPYELFYEEEYYDEPIYEDDENQEPIEKEKTVYTINIGGTFNNLVEKNEYSFVITSVIDNTESQIYASKVYIPSTYIDVLEESVEVYKDRETDEYVASYMFFVSYETEAELYVELKHAKEDGNYVLEDTSERYKLETVEQQADGNQFYYEFSGEFTNLVEYGDYILNLVSNVDGVINTPYTSRFVAYEDKVVISYFVDEDNFSYEVYYEDELTLELEVTPYEYLGGYIYYEVENIKTGETINSEYITITDKEGPTPAFARMTLDDITTNYIVRVHSVIDGDDVMVYETEVETSVALGSVLDGVEISSINHGNGTIHTISYVLYTEFSASTYFKVTQILDDVLVYTSEQYNERTNEVIHVSEELTSLTDRAAYLIQVYGNWGNQDVLIYEDSFEAVEYGIEVDSEHIVSDYEEEMITIPITVKDRYSYLDQFMAYLTIGEQEPGGNNDYITEFNEESTEIVFYVAGHTKGTFGRLRLEATDSNNNDTTTVFVDMAIWY
ncbi:MAG: hypothetical protein J6X03_02135 [Bacilli bacterium]|nr:hypothetical protein [Bacilli bacterium]